MAPVRKPIISSFKVCAFISRRDDATKPLSSIKNRIENKLWVSKCKLRPSTKKVNALMPSMCKLVFILANNRIKAVSVLNKAPKKKKCNSG